MPQKQRTALVTSASSGIGYELTKLFAADGYDLVLVARSEQKLKELAARMRKAHGVNATVLAKDLTDPATPDEIFGTLQAQSMTVDVLVNNAGYGTYGSFCEIEPARDINMVQLNVVALTHLTKLFLPTRISPKLAVQCS